MVNLFTNQVYRVRVTAVDRCGNRLDRGGANVACRIAAIGGVAPPKAGDNNFEVEDMADGSYFIILTSKAPVRCPG